MSFDLELKNGDLTIQSGDLGKVTKTDKLVQDILKIAITPAGSNPYQLWYGSLISKTLIGSYLDPQITTQAGQNQLQTALNTLQQLQISQSALQKLSAEEQLGAVQAIDVRRNPTDPRLFTVGIVAINRAFKKVQASFSVAPF